MTRQAPSSQLWWQPVAVAIGREILIRLRSKTFMVSLVASIILTAGAVIVPAVMGSKQPIEIETVGILGPPSARAAVSPLLQVVAHSDEALLRLRPIANIAVAKSELQSKKIDMVVLADSRLLVLDPLPSKPTSARSLFVLQCAYQLGLHNAIAGSGLTSNQVRAIVNPRPVQVHSIVSPSKAKTTSFRFSPTQSIAMYGTIALLLLLQISGSWILMGVIQEKSTRVIEILLSAIQPLQLLTAKIIGIGVIVIGQAALMASVAFLSADAVGSAALKAVALESLTMPVAWLILGYTFYSVIFAAAGSLVSRQEDAQGIMFPLQLPLMVGYISVFPITIGNKSGLLFHVLAWLPPTAPFDMPALYSIGAVPLWEVGASALLTLLSSIAMLRLGGRVYERAVLRIGQRVRISEVFGSKATLSPTTTLSSQ